MQVSDSGLSRQPFTSLLSQYHNPGLNDKFDWIHDTFLILIRAFPSSCSPTTVISMNAYYDPHTHMKIDLPCVRSARKATSSSVRASPCATCTTTCGSRWFSTGTISPNNARQRSHCSSSDRAWKIACYRTAAPRSGGPSQC